MLNDTVCERSNKFLWDHGDKVGSGATSDVFKAYNIATGEIVAAKVSKITSRLYHTQSTYRTDGEETNNPPSIFDQEINFLRNTTHDNIVRFIARERIVTSDDPHALLGREVLFMEYCNKGSVGDMLKLPANRYGLSEDIIMLIMKDVISALNYLHTKQIIHRDIKPDNIMQSIDVNGKITFKLTDLGVARQINPGEQTSDSIRGTEEYIHPVVYCAVYPDIKTTIEGKTVRTRPQFPFEVEMWSFGVTIYQCATGRIPFQPSNGTRGDRDTMREILTSIPQGCISGVQSTPNGEIQWSKTLPEWCRLSSTLKEMLEKLLSNLFETDKSRLMAHTDFFHKINQILNLVPIYYLNVKRYTLTCGYFQSDYPIHQVFDQIRRENGDGIHVDYHCLFQNVFYPLSKTKRMTVKTFCEQLPMQTSRGKPLVIYTFSSLKFDLKYVSNVSMPEVKSIENIQIVFSSVYDWSTNMTGLFFYLKKQLMEYEYIIQITQSSIVTMHRFLKTKLLELLSSIREKLIDYQTIDELEKVSDQIESKNNPTSGIDQSLADVHNNERQPSTSVRPHNRSIIRSFHMDDTSNDDMFSQETTASSSDEPNLSEIRSILRSSPNLYHQLINYDKELSEIIRKNFSDQLTMTTNLSQQNSNYSSHIQRIDKHIKEATDLNETFRRDSKMNIYGPLQMTYHIIRRKKLIELHEKYIRYINETCYPLVLEIFNEFSKLIKQQADINQEFQRIQYSYNNQHVNNISIDNFRQVISNELQKMGTTTIPLSSDPHPSSTCLEHDHGILKDQLANTEEHANFNRSDNVNDSNTIFMNRIHLTIQNTIEQVENNSTRLVDIIEQIRARTIN